MWSPFGMGTAVFHRSYACGLQHMKTKYIQILNNKSDRIRYYSVAEITPQHQDTL